VYLLATDQETGEEKVVAASHNLIVTVGKALVANMLSETSGYDTGITYCAVGTGITAPLVSDTTLTTEHARATITRYTVVSNVATYRTFFVSTAVNVFIKEIGLFGHSTAGAGVNTGVLFNHALLSYDNSGGSPVDLTILIEVTFG